MTSPQTTADLIEQLGAAQQTLIDHAEGMSLVQFTRQTGTSWSAAEYVKHLLLSIRPVTKALEMDPQALQRRFGQADHASASYDAIALAYDARLKEGIRAENYEKMVPSSYRMPDDLEDEKAFLLQEWTAVNHRMLDALQRWQDADLEQVQLLHPALGMLTMREMLYFTLHHNRMHTRDVQQAGGAAAG